MRKTVAATIAVVMLGALGYVAGVGRSDTSCATYEFPSTMWKRTGATGDRSEATVKARRKAADALRACELLDGMTKRQVTKLLGRHYRAPDIPNSWEWTIGPERGPFSVDDEILVADFKGGRVTRVAVATG